MSEIVRRVVEPGFEPVVAAFEEGFRGRTDMGAALAIRRGGVTVVDVYGGVADARTARPWTDDTVSVVFSCTKGLMSILAAQLVESGDLDYDAPVARYWPEFAQAGKSGVLVRHILSHRSGVSAPRDVLTTADALDWERVTSALAAQEPLWEPGTSHAYHALTHGWLIGEVIRRITGRMPGELFDRSIARPLGVAAWIGLPPAIEPRVAHLRSGPTLDALVERQAAERDPATIDWPSRAMTLGGAFDPRLVTEDGDFNAPEVHAAQIPGAGGIASASALAAIWSAAVVETDGVRLLGEGILDRALEIQSQGEPFFPVPGPWPRWGMGFQRSSDARRHVTDAGFGHDGAGGQVAFAEPELEVGFAYVTNLMEADDPRATAIVDALREVLR